MPRDTELYISDIKSACDKIFKFTNGMNREHFFKDELVYDAVLRNLMVIGEAAKNLPEERRSKFIKIEWKKICGFRDVITHAYFGIDNTILWDIIQTQIPALSQELKNNTP